MLLIPCNIRIKSWKNWGDHPETKTEIKPFIYTYHWEGIYYPSKIDDWKKAEKNILTIPLIVLHSKKETTYPAYVLTYNLKC